MSEISRIGGPAVDGPVGFSPFPKYHFVVGYEFGNFSSLVLTSTRPRPPHPPLSASLPLFGRCLSCAAWLIPLHTVLFPSCSLNHEATSAARLLLGRRSRDT